MEVKDTKICLKKIKKHLKNTKKIMAKQKSQHKKFYLFFFTWYKNGTKSFTHFIKVKKNIVI